MVFYVPRCGFLRTAVWKPLLVDVNIYIISNSIFQVRAKGKTAVRSVAAKCTSHSTKIYGARGGFRGSTLFTLLDFKRNSSYLKCIARPKNQKKKHTKLCIDGIVCFCIITFYSLSVRFVFKSISITALFTRRYLALSILYK